MIHTGDCIEVMAGLEANSVDAVCTDPPYGLEFMGREWDSFKLPGKRPRMGKATGDPQRRHTGTPAFGAAGNRVCRTCGGDEYRATPTATRFKCECDAPDFPNHSRAQNNAFQAWCEAWGREALRVTKPGGYLLAFGGTRTHHRLVCGLEDAGWIIRDELDWIYLSGFPKGRANLKPAHEPIVLARKPGPLRHLEIERCRIPFSSEDSEPSLTTSSAASAESSSSPGEPEPVTSSVAEHVP